MTILVKRLPRFEKAYAALQALEAREGWSRGDIQAFQLALLNPLQFDHLFEAQPCIRRWQIKQWRDGSATISLELVDQRRSVDVERVRLAVQRLLQGYPVAIDVVPAIAPCAGGKPRWILSDLAPTACRAA